MPVFHSVRSVGCSARLRIVWRTSKYLTSVIHLQLRVKTGTNLVLSIVESRRMQWLLSVQGQTLLLQVQRHIQHF